MLLWFFCGLILGGVQTGVAIILEYRPPDDDDRGGGRRDPVPVPVVAGRRG